MQKTINCNGILINLETPKVMGIVNVTPDSFYKGSRIENERELSLKVDAMVQEGVDILDLGAMSSRPNAKIIDPKEEWGRLTFAIDYVISNHSSIPISIDTIHSFVAQNALNKGCHVINDISGGHFDEEMIPVVSQFNVPFIAMHMKGTPKNMVQLNKYPNGLLIDILAYCKERIQTLQDFSIRDIIIDPGFGFAKNINQNFEILSLFHTLKILDKPLLAGVSRKSMIYKTLHTEPEESLNGTTVLNMVALQQGANILRVHDVKEAKEVITLFQKLKVS